MIFKLTFVVFCQIFLDRSEWFLPLIPYQKTSAPCCLSTVYKLMIASYHLWFKYVVLFLFLFLLQGCLLLLTVPKFPITQSEDFNVLISCDIKSLT